jgi:DNA-binding CsgD family transcriptional regulator
MLWCASRQRVERSRSAEGAQVLRHLAPHLQRAMRVHLRLGRLSVEQQAAIEALDLLNPALFVVDASTGIKFANHAGEALLTRMDGVRSERGKLCAFNVTLTNRLRALVAHAAGVGHDVAVGGAMAIERPSSNRAYQVLVSPLTTRTIWRSVVSQGPAAVVLIIDPDLAPANVEQQLRAFYGLTPAEARLACAVGQGNDVSAVAEALGVLPSTARTHLHHVFIKTGTQGQAELVRLVDKMAFIRHRGN